MNHDGTYGGRTHQEQLIQHSPPQDIDQGSEHHWTAHQQVRGEEHRVFENRRGHGVHPFFKHHPPDGERRGEPHSCRAHRIRRPLELISAPHPGLRSAGTPFGETQSGLDPSDQLLGDAESIRRNPDGFGSEAHLGIAEALDTLQLRLNFQGAAGTVQPLDSEFPHFS